ncbi:PLP-dependent aminotransferase family protein [Reyranella sp. CPCC 100927]|uniref:aminotransferase-like domain-containing protein n=1 Tax=Reyranella sp. CPCC 100927 TaxID=2599616 RepID=UPI0011B7B7FE|nr:PLP-dependent aminotransferase family protein [Reyranella sp. CPCC 100927]TWT05776.1 PLP-dependent aminotransferase family protein [Reyranella sp. CPCC 100927]
MQTRRQTGQPEPVATWPGTRNRRQPPVAWERILAPLDRQDRAHIQLMQAVIDAIEGNRVPQGARLPSGRDLARMLGIGRNTAMAALAGLVEQGYLVARERSGVFVADRPPVPVARPRQNRNEGLHWQRRLGTGPVAEPETAGADAGPGPRYSFLYGQLDMSLFPAAQWRECERAALSVLEIARWGRDMVDEDDAELVEQLRKHVLPHHGIWARPDEIIITLGGQQGRYLVAQLLSRQGTRAGIENPGMPDMAEILRLTGADIRLLALDEDGLVLSPQLDTCDVVYATVGHQNPTTATMPLARRQALLERAASRDFVIVEDTFETEFLGDAAMPPALKSLDTGHRVVYIGSLSKLVAPGLRVGFVVAHPVVVRKLRALRRLMHRHPPGNNQRALAIFIKHGHYRAYLRRAASELGRRSAAMATALDRWLPDCRWRHCAGASSFWIELPAGTDGRRLVQAAGRVGVSIDCGDRFFLGADRPTHFLRLAVSTMNAAQIEAGIRLLATARTDAG